MWEAFMTAGGIGAVAYLLSVVIVNIPTLDKTYRDHVDWRDKRKRRRQAREISTVSPTTGTITKRSA